MPGAAISDDRQLRPRRKARRPQHPQPPEELQQEDFVSGSQQVPWVVALQQRGVEVIIVAPYGAGRLHARLTCRDAAHLKKTQQLRAGYQFGIATYC